MRVEVAGGLRARLPAYTVRQPWSVLWSLALVQWLLLVLLTQRIVHNGWLFDQDGTGTYFYSTAWSLAHGRIPPALVGYGWPLLTAPIAGVAGINFLNGLPAVVLLQTLVLLPVALVAVYGVASRIGGRLFGYFTAAVWVLLPYAAHQLFTPGYHATYVERLLPQGLGLTGLGDFPAMVCVLVAAYFALASFDTADRVQTTLAGLFAGFAIALDPGNVLFLAAPAAGYALARQWRPALVFGLALLPALVTVTLWQYRGLGHVPHVHASFDLQNLKALRLDFRSVFYSDRLVEVPFIAGAIALGRRSWAKSGFVAAWFLSYLLVRGSAGINVGAGTWFGAFMPAYPAFAIACCAIPFLVPRLGERLARAAIPAPPRLDWRDQRFVAAAIVLAALPVVVIAAFPGQRTVLATYSDDRALLPISAGFQPQVSESSGAVELTWPRVDSKVGAAFYAVFRSSEDGSQGLACRDAGATARCRLAMARVGGSEGLSVTDLRPSGRWVYRVGFAANAHTDPNSGGVVLLSAPVDVKVP